MTHYISRNILRKGSSFPYVPTKNEVFSTSLRSCQSTQLSSVMNKSFFLNLPKVLNTNNLTFFNKCTCVTSHFVIIVRRFNICQTLYPAGNYMFKVNNRNIRTMCEICSKLIIKIRERRQSLYLKRTPT